MLIFNSLFFPFGSALVKRVFRFIYCMEVQAKARGHDQNTTWRLFRPGHSGGCGDGIGRSDKYA
jgi:hypothetical protein